MPRHVPRERVRLTVAIMLSALVHLGFADRLMVRAPGHATLFSPAIISARLEIPATPQPEPSQQDDAKVVHEHVPDTQSRTRLDQDSVRKRSGSQSAYPPTFSAKTPDTHAPASALPPTVDPVYYPARQLDVYPALIQPVSLDYPRQAADASVGGRVLLMLQIDETGAVRELSIIETGPARVIEDTLRAAFSEARFSPARKDGRAVKSRVLIGVDYR